MVMGFALLAVLRVDPGCSAELFRIERSKNANVVLYEAKTHEKGSLDTSEPIVASWLMLAAKGQREALTFFERRFAYGFESSPSPKGGFELKLQALKSRAIQVIEREGCAVALSSINGQEALLKRIYVRADDSTVVPSVQYVELFGVDAISGAARYEKLQP